ncbi:hypothetical protein IAT40_000432 [Kwoniella sp. CBS 6097]
MSKADDHLEATSDPLGQWRLPSPYDGLDEDEAVEVEAGPSDYWRRSPTPVSPSPFQIPPSQWRQASDNNVDFDYLENGPSDSCIVSTTSDQPPLLSSSNVPSTDSSPIGVSLNIVEELEDKRSYESRKQAILEDLPHSSQNTRDTSRLEAEEQRGGYFGSYNQNYREIMNDGDGQTATADEEEEFGTPASPRPGHIGSSYTHSLSSMPTNSKPNGLRRNGMPGKRSSFVRELEYVEDLAEYVDPSISRLRSHMRTPSGSSQQSLGLPQLAHLRSSSHFSQISDAKSETQSNSSMHMPTTHLQTPLIEQMDYQSNAIQTPAFVFHPLRRLSAHLFGRVSDRGDQLSVRPVTERKASSIFKLGRTSECEDPPPDLGHPTVMDIRGMIAVGTEHGYCIICSFGQEVQHILGNEGSLSPVTVITISNDQTYIAVGRASGNIHLYNLANPSKPARTIVSLSLNQVLTGRKEGHLHDSRILHIGFVGARHTSIVTGDEYGRSFWWSLGRVVGVESNDVIRMLGSYPDATNPSTSQRKPSTLFAALPLPLDHHLTARPVDSLNLSALLTPSKLVVVGMKPSPKTWYRAMRENQGGELGSLTGCALWGHSATRHPILVYSWGSTVRVLHVTTEGDGGVSESNISPKCAEGLSWQASDPVRAFEWYDEIHLLVVTTSRLVLVDLRTMAPIESTPFQTKLLTSMDALFTEPTPNISTPVPTLLHGSVRLHRNKLFILTKHNLQVGSLQHWNDRILACVHQGDFLGAIRIALTYYEDKAVGNLLHLPEDLDERKTVISTKLRELMLASLQWAFSPERLTDDTHYSVDGRGVDLTGLFEGLAVSCINACLSNGDHAFLFDEAYEHFAQAGIHRIFLLALEPHIFSGRLREIPPNITQSMIAMHEQKGELDLAETVIWNVDPMSLDINQAIVLCEANGLWDAMIHVYTRAMKDYIAPLVKLIGVVRDIQHHRLSRPTLVAGDKEDDDLEELAPNAYKLYAYIEATLSGLSYPSGEPLPDAEGYVARADVYTFIFQGRTIAWPPTQTGGDLVLTGEQGSVEPPYPYLSLLLRFDTEAFLHSMDIAFEDPYLNDATGAINRQSVVNLMLDVMDPEYFHPGDITFLHIFVARNLPKYPQFLFIPPSTLHRILISLASDPDQSTREDRQLAAEYLLSAYKPHDLDTMLRLFEQAGFFRILRTAYRKEGKWARLISTLLKDPDAGASEVFTSLHEIIRAARAPTQVQDAFVEALPHLLDLGVRETALLVDRDLPDCHQQALDHLANAPHKQLAYLRCLLEPDVAVVDQSELSISSTVGIGTNVDRSARHLYISLLSRLEPERVVPFLDKTGASHYDLAQLIVQCADQGAYEPQMWALDRQGRPKEALEVAGHLLRIQGVALGEAMLLPSQDINGLQVQHLLQTIQGASRMAVRLCQRHSVPGENASGEVEDMWLGILHDIIELVHSASLRVHDGAAKAGGESTVIDTLRSLVQETLASLLSSSSSSLSFPRLFKRLVDASTSTSATNKGRAYSEFRTILSGMLDSYRAEKEMLGMTNKLVEADLHLIMTSLVAHKESGWRPESMYCKVCRLPAFDHRGEAQGVVVQGSGALAHQLCIR